MASVINEKTQYQDASGNAIVNGFIHIGVQNQDPTLLVNKITIYSDRDLSVVIDNPQRTDSDGKSINKIHIPGKYSIVVQDADSTQRCSDLDAGESPATGITNLTNVAGANTITADASPTITILVDKEIYVFTSIGTNTGAVTLAIDLVAAKSVLKYHDQPLVAGDLEINQVVVVMYNGTDDVFELLSNPIIEELRFFGDHSSLQTEIATTSGTTHDFTGIPSWVNKVTAIITGVSIATGGFPVIRIGDSGGFETSEYVNSVTDGTNILTSTDGWYYVGASSQTGSDVVTGKMVIERENSTDWVMSVLAGATDGSEVFHGIGSKTLSGQLTQIRLISLISTFDLGLFNVRWE